MPKYAPTQDVEFIGRHDGKDVLVARGDFYQGWKALKSEGARLVDSSELVSLWESVGVDNPVWRNGTYTRDIIVCRPPAKMILSRDVEIDDNLAQILQTNINGRNRFSEAFLGGRLHEVKGNNACVKTEDIQDNPLLQFLMGDNVYYVSCLFEKAGIKRMPLAYPKPIDYDFAFSVKYLPLKPEFFHQTTRASFEYQVIGLRG